MERKVGDGTYVPFPALGPDSVSFTDTAPTGGSVNTYRVRALNSGGASEYSGEVPVAVPATSQTTGNTSSSASGGGGGGGGGCFIATAAFGSPMAGEVGILREFRDRYLLTNIAGRAFVAVYYEMSPPLASRIARSVTLRSVTRGTLRPVIAWVHLFMLAPTLTILVSACCPILGAVFLVTCRHRARRGRTEGRLPR